MATGFTLEGAFMIRNVHTCRPDNSILLGEACIFGAEHMATFLLVQDMPAMGQEAVLQVGVGSAARLVHGATPLQTVEVPGFPGEYLLSICPEPR